MSFAIVGLLICIALAIYAVQFRYDPALWRAQPTQTPSRAAVSSAESGAGALPGLEAMSAPEHYDAATLSDKINGKAELYLPAGFESLESRRFALSADRSRWMELFIYDMGGPGGAFTVYSQQRRDQAQPLDLTADAYRSANGVFMIQGRYYVEIIGSDGSDDLLAHMTAVAREFIQQHPAGSAAADERALFPQAGLVADSIALSAENTFGFERFDRIFSAQYQNGDQVASAFVSRRSSAAEAAELARAYVAHLLEYGGQRVDPPDSAPPVVIVEILDMIEIVFHQGEILAGIHEAADLPYALSLADRLYRSVNEARHEP